MKWLVIVLKVQYRIDTIYSTEMCTNPREDLFYLNQIHIAISTCKIGNIIDGLTKSLLLFVNLFEIQTDVLSLICMNENTIKSNFVSERLITVSTKRYFIIAIKNSFMHISHQLYFNYNLWIN